MWTLIPGGQAAGSLRCLTQGERPVWQPTPLESTAAYIMSIQPLNVAWEEETIRKSFNSASIQLPGAPVWTDEARKQPPTGSKQPAPPISSVQKSGWSGKDLLVPGWGGGEASQAAPQEGHTVGGTSFRMLAKRLPFRSTLISDSKTTQGPTAGVRDREVGPGCPVLV